MLRSGRGVNPPLVMVGEGEMFKITTPKGEGVDAPNTRRISDEEGGKADKTIQGFRLAMGVILALMMVGASSVESLRKEGGSRKWVTASREHKGCNDTS